MEKIILNTLNWENKGCKPIEIPTDDEVKALKRLFEIKKRVREIRKELTHMASDASYFEQRSRAESELIQLKKEWYEWEEMRDIAAKERMITLGHIEPD